jgi:flagellar M-ring protein FliF
MVTALAALGVVALVLTLGIKPVVRTLLPAPAESDSMSGNFLPGPDMASFPIPNFDPDSFVPPPIMTDMSMDGSGSPALSDFGSGTKKRIQERLDQMVDSDEEQAVAILKQWIREGVAA